MAKSYVDYTADGSASQFNLTFPYMSRDHVSVLVSGTSVPFTWVNDSRVQTDGLPAIGNNVRVRRNTPTTALTVYPPSSTLLGADLSRALQQSLYCVEEAEDGNTLEGTNFEALTVQAQAAAASALVSAASIGGAKVGWDRPVKSINTGSPGSPTIGDRYLVDPAGGTGAWASISGQVAEWRAPGQWEFSGAPQVNQMLDIAGTTYRYGQEAWDVSVGWRSAFFAGGGKRGVGEPSDEPCAINSIAVDGRTTCLGVTSFGAACNPVVHYQKARGTQAAPAKPLAGDYLGSTGYRHYDPVNAIFGGSSAAVEVNLTQTPADGSFYAGCQYDIETTAIGGVRRTCVRVMDNGGFYSFGTAAFLGTDFSVGGSARWFYGPESNSGIAAQSYQSFAYAGNRNGSDGTFMLIRRDNTDVGSISVTGSGVAFNTTCDARFKTSLGTTFDSGSVIDAVSPKRFQWDEAHGGKEDFGFFAQELHAVVPDAVHVGSSETVPVTDKDFEPWQVNNSKLVPILWAELQSLRKRVQELEAK